MKKKLIAAWSCGVILLSLFSSCEKYLDQNPDMRAELNTTDKIKRLVTNAYPGQNYLAMMETYSDNVEDKGVGDLNDPVRSLYFWEDIADNGTSTPTSYWNACYSAIASANHALRAIEQQPDLGAAVLPYKGEALVARAYAHFMLVNLFAKVYEIGGANNSPGIPYATDPETSVIQEYDRGTVASVYAAIRADLEEGIPLLNGGTWEVPKYHFTPAAAHAFASRFYLFTGEWEKVVSHASAIFAGGDFTGRIRPYNSTFRTMSFEETRIAYTRANQPFNLLINETYSNYQRFTGSRYAMGVRIFNEVYNGQTAAGNSFYNFGLSYGPPHYTTYIWREHFHVTDAAANIGFPQLMVPVLVTDEALLSRAEAHLELGNNAAALADLNLIASNRVRDYNPSAHAVTAEKSKVHFNLTDDKQALIETTLEFKRLAFIDEGLRWLDIIRKKLPVRHNVIDAQERESFIDLGPEDPRRVFQIPVDANLSNIAPNPR
ncbi:RagB/SusD family nutrient uptake outer membrane protein [Sphingobacterium sp. lm-10]|uniref:RagB/SusD family nutrient uptake outer membrane protein n=1 Tax=Sphingobacterium sp. lm-10 TaxID=2944904 RepID=UPI002021C195|nr:RagB/SusD family nutrient uptake outer membrane protein [Sphingobacterium sp. lm-10]MCL7988156.1 RagB/SusD family nutrient uptake outer membrane protein [Sphingobacterium sp. lm-10]